MRKTVCFMILVIVSVFFVSACGQVDQEKQCEHEWTPADCLTPKTCSKCGITEGTALGHDEVKDPAEEATLFENGKTEGSHCGRCGYVISAQNETPSLIYPLIESVKASPDKYSDGAYEKYYYSPDFASKNKSLSRFKDCIWLVTVTYDTKMNRILFESAAQMDPGGVGTIRIVINWGVTPKRYNYVYNWENGGTNYWFSGTFLASSLSTTEEATIDECYGISSDRKQNSYHKEKVADMLKQLARLMDQLFQHEKLNLRMSSFGVS